MEEPRGESLGHWARRTGITYRTAWRWFRQNRLPKGVVGEQMPSGTILVQDHRARKKKDQNRSAVIYVRINPREPRAALQQQVESCRAFCRARGWTVTQTVRELAPGVGSRRTKLGRLIEAKTPRLVVATTSVLSRFDFSFYESLWRTMGSELVVVDRSDEVGGKGGAFEDLTDAINITCHRHFGPKKGTALVQMLSRVARGTLHV